MPCGHRCLKMQQHVLANYLVCQSIVQIQTGMLIKDSQLGQSSVSRDKFSWISHINKHGVFAITVS